MFQLRPPAVAGLFYPGAPQTLRQTVDALLAEAKAPAEAPPKALIVPHAGYVYSGPVAATAYALLRPLAEKITRVVLLGPSHRVPLRGMATSAADAFDTPLGQVPLDREAVARLAEAGVPAIDAAHAQEHALEVQLPFLQAVLAEFTLVPIVVGLAEAAEVAAVLDRVWGGEETLILVSSDLSHYHDYDTARRIDGETVAAIARLDPAPLDGDHACGCHAVAGLLTAARQRGLGVATLDVRNSGDTAGPRGEVVGYASFAFH